MTTAEALVRVLELLRSTCSDYERDCLGAAECGYWNREQKVDYENARDAAAQLMRDSGEGPWDSEADAIAFGVAEVGAPWMVRQDGCVWRMLILPEQLREPERQ
jgi:hypothetical protein